MTFPILLAKVGLGGAYDFYALSAAISAIFVFVYVYET
jgi:SP family sugar:H+ symporter-like MFS transporter